MTDQNSAKDETVVANEETVVEEVVSSEEGKGVDMRTTEEKKDDENRAGVKEIAGEIKENENDENDENEEEVGPSFFVESDDRIKVEVNVLWNPKNGRLVYVAKKDDLPDLPEIKTLRHSVEWFDFSLPGYADISSYRQRSSTFRRDANGMVIDRTHFRSFLLIWHLKDWSLRNRRNEKVELKHEKDGSLTDESLTLLNGAVGPMLDVVMTILEREILIS